MIQSLKIKNFQSHKDTELKFDKSLNVIVGKSDSGKSAIIRALNWIINNKPAGDYFRSSWGGKTEVEIDYNKIKLKKELSKSERKYDIEGLGLKGFGKDVPDEVKDFFNFDKINIQYQMDPPFLLSNTSGEAAKYINEIVNIDSIDQSLSLIEKLKRDYTRTLERKEEELQHKEFDLKKFSFVDDLERDLKKVKELFENITDEKNNVYELDLLFNKISEKERELDDIFIGELAVDPIIKEIKELEDLKVCAEDLILQKDFIEKAQKTFDNYNYIIEDLKKEYGELMPEECPLCGQKI